MQLLQGGTEAYYIDERRRRTPGAEGEERNVREDRQKTSAEYHLPWYVERHFERADVWEAT
jgi:hypothetical protein